MIAFTIFWWPIYRYGIFYLVTFVFGYRFLYWLWTTRVFASYAWLQTLLTEKRDDLFLVGLLGVIVWGRLWHVLLYDRAYYSQNLSEIIMINQGWMSFIWGVVWVLVGILYMRWKLWLQKEEVLLLGDIVLCIVPLGIFLWRIGNFLNQELRWLPLAKLSSSWQQLFSALWLDYVYSSVDEQPRVNTNVIQSVLEGLLPLCIGMYILLKNYLRGSIRPWYITGLFFITYACVRFFVEFFKDMPPQEYLWSLTVSQYVMFLFFFFGRVLLRWSSMIAKKSA